MAADSHGESEHTTMKFEVERKFRMPPNFKEILNKKGARLLQEITFSDVYFDALNHELTLSGCWLRKRNQKWEQTPEIEKLPSRDRKQR